MAKNVPNTATGIERIITPICLQRLKKNHNTSAVRRAPSVSAPRTSEMACLMAIDWSIETPRPRSFGNVSLADRMTSMAPRAAVMVLAPLSFWT
ncbi:MAG: hypothetical protein KCHDKBKB_00886 [Elusimicrobia bacterium]|nr:hypothetical protein [Elusimicrobiota bacterium]